jgi:hypothetical protein
VWINKVADNAGNSKALRAAEISTRVLVVAAVGLVLAVALGSFVRLRFGVDVTDESYYAVLPYRFALGDTPYVSELNVRQNAAILTWPFVKLWVALTGGADGIILFLRYCYFAVRVAVSVLAVRALWHRAPPPLALSAGLVPIAYFFFIPALSYNTIAGSALVAACLCLLLWWETARRRFAVGMLVCAMLAAFAHPAATPATILIALLAARRAEPADRAWCLRATIIAVAVALVIGVVVMLLLGLEHVSTLLRSADSFTGPTASVDALVGMLPRLLALSRLGLPTLGLWMALWFVGRIPRAAAAPMIFAYAAAATLADNQATMVWLALGALPIAFVARSLDGDLLPITAISLVAGFFIALFSTNGVVNMAVASEVAVMVAGVAAARLVPVVQGAFGTIVMAMVVCRLAIGQWTDTYRDGRIIALSRVVESGPFQGLRTGPRKLEYITGMQTALRAHERGKGSLIAFNSIPAAYLMVSIPPGLPSTWVVHGPQDWAVNARAALAAAVPQARGPVLLMQLKHQYLYPAEDHQFTYAASDPFVRAVHALHPRLLVDTPDLTLFEASTAR